MANVVFKRGLQATLNSMNTVEDGVFYLTTDTNRLYVGQGTTKKLLNQTVQIVSRINDLTALSNSWTADQKADHINDFYYVNGAEGDDYRNILVVWTRENGNYEWRQINPDHNTAITSATFTAAADTNVGTVTIGLHDSDEANTTASFSIAGAGSVSVTASGNQVTVTGTQYSLTNKIDASSTTSTTIYLAQDGTTASASTLNISVADGSPLSVQGINGGIVLDANNTYSETATFSLPSAGTLQYVITDTDSRSVTATVSNLGIVLNDQSYVALNNTSGKTAGALYSKAEVDSLINGLNGMTYKGTLGSTGSTTALPAVNVKSGDTYIIVEDGLTSGSPIFGGATFASGTSSELANGTTIGDMIVASGTEDSTGYITNNLQWTYVPSGNDSLNSVTYHGVVSENSLSLANENGTIVSQINLVAGTDMALSSASSTPVNGSANSGLTTTINHATITTTTGMASTLSDGTTSFTAIKGITVNNGHVTAIETDVFTPATYTLQNSVAQNGTKDSHNDGTNGATATVSLYNEADSTVVNSVGFNITSSSLKITADTANNAKNIIVNMEWGTF